MEKCWKCGGKDIPEPLYCCSDLDGMCGCRGYPITPPYCEPCWTEIKKEAEQNAHAKEASN